MSNTASAEYLTANDLTAVVVNLNGGDEAVKCISSLLASEPKPSEVVVVDNGSTDHSLESFRQMEARGLIKVIALDSNVGLARARNIAVAATNSSYVAFLDNDTTFDPSWAACALMTMIRFNAACVQCKLVLASDQTKLDSIGYLLGPLGFPSHIVRLGDLDGPIAAEPMQLFGVKAAGMVVTRAALEVSGGFDDSYFIYGEETDLCWRIHRAGGSVFYASESVIFHNAAGTKRFLPERAASLLYQGGTRNYIRTVVKNSPATSVPKDLFGQVAVWLGVAGYFAVRGRRKEASLVARGVADALFDLPRLLLERHRSTLPYVRVPPHLRKSFNIAYLRKVVAAV